MSADTQRILSDRDPTPSENEPAENSPKEVDRQLTWEQGPIELEMPNGHKISLLQNTAADQQELVAVEYRRVI